MSVIKKTTRDKLDRRDLDLQSLLCPICEIETQTIIMFFCYNNTIEDLWLNVRQLCGNSYLHPIYNNTIGWSYMINFIGLFSKYVDKVVLFVV